MGCRQPGDAASLISDGHTATVRRQG